MELPCSSNLSTSPDRFATFALLLQYFYIVTSQRYYIFYVLYIFTQYTDSVDFSIFLKKEKKKKKCEHPQFSNHE